MTQRKTAKKLVEMSRVRMPRTWYDRLSPPDRAYVDNVVSEVKKFSDTPIHAVARHLIREMQLSVSPCQVSKILVELLHHAS
jgi:hypothetical protein